MLIWFKRKKKLIILIVFTFFIFYACKKKIEVTSQIDEYQSKIAKADALFKKGSYSCLKEGFEIYQDLLSFSDYQTQTKEMLIKTALLLSIREKELAILEQTYLKKASELIQHLPEPSEFQIYWDIIDSLPIKVKGHVRDDVDDFITKSEFFKKLVSNTKSWNKLLKEKAETEEFFTYIYLSLNYSYISFIEEKADFSHFIKLYPHSALIAYITAICQRDNKELLRETIEKEPSFAEVYYFMGENALEERKLLTAEKHFLKCYKEIPKSSSTTFSLARMCFFIGEIEESLEFYEKTIELAPEHRKALLGKAICLSNLGKYEEAMEVLNKLLALGKWYLGETHYWLAWNQNALEQLEEAWKNIQNSKLYLPEDSKVFTLAGIVAFKKEKFEVAEKNFKKALDIDSSTCQALFYLGRIYSQRQNWVASGFYFEQAANCYEVDEVSLRQKISEIENSALAQERKKKLILRKEKQLEELLLSKATSFYNAAACYLNAEFKDKALTFAEKASLHPYYKEKAEELISKIERLK